MSKQFVRRFALSHDFKLVPVLYGSAFPPRHHPLLSVSDSKRFLFVGSFMPVARAN